MIKINKTWVNPEYVTSIQPLSGQQDGTKSRVWVIGNAGYGTYSIDSPLTADEMAHAIGHHNIHADCEEDDDDMFSTPTTEDGVTPIDEVACELHGMTRKDFPVECLSHDLVEIRCANEYMIVSLDSSAHEFVRNYAKENAYRYHCSAPFRFSSVKKQSWVTREAFPREEEARYGDCEDADAEARAQEERAERESVKKQSWVTREEDIRRNY